GEEVFEHVAGVVPAAAGVDRGAVWKRTVGGATVVLVAIFGDPGIEAAALLAHEFERSFGEFAVDAFSDEDGLRSGIADLEDVFAGGIDFGEIEFGVVGEASPGGT